MKTKERKAYKSLKYKTFRTSFVQMLETEFNVVASGKIADLLVDKL